MKFTFGAIPEEDGRTEKDGRTGRNEGAGTDDKEKKEGKPEKPADIGTDPAGEERNAQSEPRKRRGSLWVVSQREARAALEEARISYEGEIELRSISFCKVETQADCVMGSLFVPKLLDVQESRYQVMFFINKDNIVLADESGLSKRILSRLRMKKGSREVSKEKFLYYYIAECISRDAEQLARYEKSLMQLEERIQMGRPGHFQEEIVPLRRELLLLRGYYDELADLGRELEENEGGFFAKKQLRYFGIIADRANRLMDKTAHLLEYAQQVKDAYQAYLDVKQNENMHFLTVISTLFYPLTLITGWYGMNFRNMPELENGYPWVIGASAAVVAGSIYIFKRRKML